MDKVTVALENCYGIRKLEKTFDFSNPKARACAIYAPNGAMKSSLAQTFQDIASGANSVDRIFPKRVTKRSVVDEAGAQINADRVLVVTPYSDEFGDTRRTCT